MKRDPMQVWVIEGATLTERRIACRLGLSVDGARRRIEAVLATGAGLTWAALRSVRYCMRGAS
jgi:hypothetical protein